MWMGTAPVENADESWTPGKMVWDFRQPKPPYEREFGVNVISWPVIEHYEWVALNGV